MTTLQVSNAGTASAVRKESLAAMKQYINEFLQTNSECSELRQYIESVKDNDELLLDYLLGRKYQTFIAWDTLRRYAENRFQLYPELFPKEWPRIIQQLLETRCAGVLKNVDKFGRRIGFFDVSKWDPNIYSVDDLAMAAVFASERLWRRPEILHNGIVFVENIQGFSAAHARQHSMSTLLKIRSIFLYSFPVSPKGFFYVNTPYLFKMVSKIVLPLFPKNYRSRVYMYSSGQTPTELLEMASPEILPTWLGGKLSVEEAAEEMEFYDSLNLKDCQYL